MRQAAIAGPVPDPPELLRIPFSTFCRKTEWGLTQAGIAYHALDISIPGMRNIRRANPWERTVPVLFLDGRALPGSHRILEWADANRASGAKPLFPDDERTDVLTWEAWADDHLGPLLRRETYRVLHKNVKPFARSPVHRFRLWTMKPGFKIAARHYKALTVDPQERAATHDAIARIIGRLRKTDTGYLFGETPTAADYATAAFLEPVMQIGEELQLVGDDGWGELQQYVRTVKPRKTTRVGARPARRKDWERLEAMAKGTEIPGLEIRPRR